jgi:hypothetical protein
MSDDETVTITIEVTERQYNDALSALNSKEIELKDADKHDRWLELSNVWNQIYKGGRDEFRDGDD